MNIADYFVTKTKPIVYTRNHFASVKIVNDEIELVPFILLDQVQGLTREEKRARFIAEMQEYGSKTIIDNKKLVCALSAIEKFLPLMNSADTLPTEIIELLSFASGEIDKRWFFDELEQMYLLYRCYRVLIWGEEQMPERYLTAIKKEVILHDAERNSVIDWCWEFVQYVCQMVQDESVRIEYKIHPPIIEESLYTKTLYHALMHQLIMHIAAGKEGLDGYQLAECQSCHKVYKKRHGNQKFCPYCSRNCERVRAYKHRKKEAAHANESHS